MCLLPYGLIRFSKWTKSEGVLSPVVLCYGVGLLLGNLFPGFISMTLAEIITQVTIALAIPLILMTSDFKALILGARSILISFLLAVLVVFAMCVSGAWLFADKTEHAADVAAMLAGVYTGGTPNMSGIKMAIDADSNIFGVLNVADIIMSGIYLIFLTSIGPVFFRKILPVFDSDKLESLKIGQDENNPESDNWKKYPLLEKTKQLVFPILLAIIIICISAGVSYLIFQDVEEALFIILITCLGITVSCLPFSKKIKGAYESGDYLLLVFSLALGLLSDFSTMLDAGSAILFFTAYVLVGTIVLHLILSRIFKLDADTVMVTSAACIFGPVFIGQIISVMKNRSLLVPGMAMGVAGYAIGNFLGILIHSIAGWVLAGL